MFIMLFCIELLLIWSVFLGIGGAIINNVIILITSIVLFCITCLALIIFEVKYIYNDEESEIEE